MDEQLTKDDLYLLAELLAQPHSMETYYPAEYSLVGDTHIAIAWAEDTKPHLAVYSIEEAIAEISESVDDLEWYYQCLRATLSMNFNIDEVDKLLKKIGVIEPVPQP